MTFQRCLAVLLSLTSFFSPVLAVGQLSAKAEVDTNIGLDDRTIKLFEQFTPKEFHDQINATIKDSIAFSPKSTTPWTGYSVTPNAVPQGYSR